MYDTDCACVYIYFVFFLFFSLDIEDLTRKTGNFKQFPIFCSMLESAVRKVQCCIFFMYPNCLEFE